MVMSGSPIMRLKCQVDRAGTINTREAMILRGPARDGRAKFCGQVRTILSRLHRFVAGTAAATLFTAGCGSASLGPNTSGPTVTGANAAQLTKVLTIVEENHTAPSALIRKSTIMGRRRRPGFSPDILWGYSGGTGRALVC